MSDSVVVSNRLFAQSPVVGIKRKRVVEGKQLNFEKVTEDIMFTAITLSLVVPFV